MKFSEIAKELRQEYGFSQKILGEKLNISPAAIGHLELGKHEPGSVILLAYANFFHVSVDYLLGREEGWNCNVSGAPLPEYTKDERNLVEAYRDLNPALQNLLWDMIHTWEKKDASKETSKKKA